MNYDNVVTSQTINCQECGESINWRSNRECDENFASVIDKLIHHMKDTKCSRERKLKIILGTKEKLSQDYYLRPN